MINLTNTILASAISGALCILCIVTFSRIAPGFGLVDKPMGRKTHSGEIPLVGGVSIFCAVLLTIYFFSTSIFQYPILFMGAVLVLLGMLDDKFNLSALIRFPVQAGVSALMIFIGGVSIESVGNIFGAGEVLLIGWVSVCFTIMCTVGVINSINMIDGIDGLSGAVIMVTLCPLLYLSWMAEDTDAVVLLCCFMAALLAFLYFNGRLFHSKAVIFMGDAGSMLFGLFIVWLLIKLSQGENAVLSPVSAGWIFGLPLVDTMSVMVRRITNGKSPFDADRGHLHHRLLDAGFSVNKAVLSMVLIHSIFICIGLVCNIFNQYEPIFFWLFVLIVIGYHFLGTILIRPIEKNINAN